MDINSVSLFNLSHKRGLSEEQTRNILQASAYSESEGEAIDIESDDEYIPPYCSSSMEEIQVDEQVSVYEEGKFVTEYVCVIETACLLLNVRVCY